MACELSSTERVSFDAVAGGREPPQKRVRELWCIIGRRSGKSRVAAALADFIAAFQEHAGKLAPGEVGTILVLAASKLQAQTVFGYVQAFFEASPILRQLVETVTADEIRLAGNIAISVHTNNYRTVRGRTLIACIFDEVGFWRDESTSLPDVETYRAVLPALATTGGMLIGISSPYAQRGLLFTKHRDCFGKDDPRRAGGAGGHEGLQPDDRYRRSSTRRTVTIRKRPLPSGMPSSAAICPPSSIAPLSSVASISECASGPMIVSSGMSPSAIHPAARTTR